MAVSLAASSSRGEEGKLMIARNKMMNNEGALICRHFSNHQLIPFDDDERFQFSILSQLNCSIPSG